MDSLILIFLSIFQLSLSLYIEVSDALQYGVSLCFQVSDSLFITHWPAHSEYANFGRILTETVECFGQSVGDNVFYHGLLGSFNLQSIEARFFIPTSMTTSISVISYHCHNPMKDNKYRDGLILGLTGSDSMKEDVRYFNCSFLSDFTNESEVIVLGGRHTMRFHSIYDMKRLHDYKYSLAAIRMIDEYFVRSSRSMDAPMVIEKVYNEFKKLIDNQSVGEDNGVPAQIEYFLNRWCGSRRSMTINMTQLTRNSFFKTLLMDCGLLVKYGEIVYSISIDLMIRLFPNAVSIKIMEQIFDEKGQPLGQIHEFLKRDSPFGDSLHKIEFIAPHWSSDQDAHATISKFNSIFFESGWTIKGPDGGGQAAQQETAGGDHGVIQILKLNQSPRRRHHGKSNSTPNVPDVTNEIFVLQEQASHGPLADEQEEEELMADDATLTDDESNAFTSVHIKLRIKQQGKKPLEVEFKFDHTEDVQHVAHEMVSELGLPSEYKEPVANAIAVCIPSGSGMKRRRSRLTRSMSSSKLQALHGQMVEIVHAIPEPEPIAPVKSQESQYTRPRRGNFNEHSENQQQQQQQQYVQQQVVSPTDTISSGGSSGNGNSSKVMGTPTPLRNMPHQPTAYQPQYTVTGPTSTTSSKMMEPGQSGQQMNPNLTNPNLSGLAAIPETGNHEDDEKVPETGRSNGTESSTSQSTHSAAPFLFPRSASMADQPLFQDSVSTPAMPMKPMVYQQSEPNKRMAITPRPPNLHVVPNKLNEKSKNVATSAGLFNSPLKLKTFHKFEFPSEAMVFLNNKRKDLGMEFENELQTMAQLYTLKLEHLQMENGNNMDEMVQELTANFNKRIEQKRREVTNKWDEHVADQREIMRLKQHLMDKALNTFKQQVHFESQKEFMEIMKSDKISNHDKEQFKQSLKQYRDQMIRDYRKFKDDHYHTYNQRLLELQAHHGR